MGGNTSTNQTLRPRCLRAGTGLGVAFAVAVLLAACSSAGTHDANRPTSRTIGSTSPSSTSESGRTSASHLFPPPATHPVRPRTAIAAPQVHNLQIPS
jgi:hypothetical protein